MVVVVPAAAAAVVFDLLFPLVAMVLVVVGVVVVVVVIVVVADINAAAAFLRVSEASVSIWVLLLPLSFVSVMPILSIPLRMASALFVIVEAW